MITLSIKSAETINALWGMVAPVVVKTQQGKGIGVKLSDGVNNYTFFLLDLAKKSVEHELTADSISDGLISCFNKTEDWDIWALANEMSKIENISDFVF